MENVFDLRDAVQYQEGAIVSKTIIKKQAGNITLFAFDKGQELSEHTAPFDAFVHLLDGKADVFISGKINEVKAGQSIVLPANVPHALRAPERFKMLLVMIKSQ